MKLSRRRSASVAKEKSLSNKRYLNGGLCQHMKNGSDADVESDDNADIAEQPTTPDQTPQPVEDHWGESAAKSNGSVATPLVYKCSSDDDGVVSASSLETNEGPSHQPGPTVGELLTVCEGDGEFDSSSMVDHSSLHPNLVDQKAVLSATLDPSAEEKEDSGQFELETLIPSASAQPSDVTSAGISRPVQPRQVQRQTSCCIGDRFTYDGAGRVVHPPRSLSLPTDCDKLRASSGASSDPDTTPNTPSQKVNAAPT